MKLTQILTLIALFVAPSLLSAQRFLNPSYSFSSKKVSYITMKNGEEIQCNVKKLKFEKGLIDELKVEDLSDKKMKIKPEDIEHMYLPPSGIEKLSKKVDFITDATMWDEDQLDGDLFAQGYVYFERSQVRIKKKTETLMLQLLNPHFSNKIRVYDDPLSKESASVGVGGITVAGGLAKSYYVKTDDVAIRLKKKEYEEEFPLYFKSCKTLVDRYKKDIDWDEFVVHIYTYATDCE